MKNLLTDYTFDASLKTLAFNKYDAIVQERILLVVNVTDGIIIYNFADPAKGGTVATNVLTMEYDTTSMDDADKIQVFYEDAAIIPLPMISGRNLYSNIFGDFSAAANNGSKTITLSAYASTALSDTISAANLMGGLVIRKNTAGNIDLLPLNHATYAANVFTLTDMVANFASGDTVSIFLIGPDKAYDETIDADKMTMASGVVRTSDTIGVAQDVTYLMNDKTELEVKRAVINVASSGDNTIVAAVTGKKIRVISFIMRNAGAVDIRFESGAGGTALTGVMETEAADPAIVAPFNPTGWFETAAGALLNLELGGAVSVDGLLSYVEV